MRHEALYEPCGMKGPPGPVTAGPRSWGQAKRGRARGAGKQPRQRSGTAALPDAVAALAKQEGTTKVNRCPRPLQSSTDPNLADLGRYGAGPTASLWEDLSLLPQADGRSEAAGNTVIYPRRCRRGVAGCLTCSRVCSERGNRGGLALPPSGEGQAHGLLMRPPRGGVPVVVRGRESRPALAKGDSDSQFRKEQGDDVE